MLHNSVFVTPLHRLLQSQLNEAQIFQKHNPGSHYCNVIYNGALKHSANSKFFSADAKWKILVGEPDFPLACVAHGKKAVVGLNELFQVADLNFSKVSTIPDAVFVQQISKENDREGDEFNVDTTHGSLVRFIMTLKIWQCKVVQPFMGLLRRVKLLKQKIIPTCFMQ